MSTSVPSSRSRSWRSLAGWLGASFAAAAVGGVGSASAPVLYPTLNRPVWAPPAWLFGPAWTVLFTLMGVAAWMVWKRRDHPGARTALVLHAVQLVFNTLWSWVFFAWRLGGLAFAEALVFEALVLATLIAFWRVRPRAGALMVPYALWVAYASALTLAVWRANPGVL